MFAKLKLWWSTFFIKVWWTHVMTAIEANFKALPQYVTSFHNTIVTHIQQPKLIAGLSVSLVLAFVVIVDLLAAKRTHIDVLFGLLDSVVKLALTALKEGGWMFVALVVSVAVVRSIVKKP